MSIVINLGTVHPVYKGTYSSTVAYEFLNRVADGKGKTYEAKQDNVAGSNLSDEGLWQLVFDANKNLEVDSITNAATGFQIPDIQIINFYNANEIDTDLISENIYGDTSVGIANVWLDGAIIGNIATLTIKLKIQDFSATLPTDSGFFFGFNLLRRLKLLTDVVSTSDSFAIGMIDFNQDVNILACRAYINSNGYLNFSLEDSGMGGSGPSNASTTCTTAEVSTTITFEVGRG